MRLAASLALVICLSSAPAFADLIDPDAGSTNNATNGTNNATTGNTANTGGNTAGNNTTGGNNATTGENNTTGGDTNAATTPSEEAKEEKGGCSVASLQGAAPVAPLLLGVALIGLTRRRRA